MNSWQKVLSRIGMKSKVTKRLVRERHAMRPLHIESLEDRRLLATLTVNTSEDGHLDFTDVQGNLTLREALAIVDNGGDLAPSTESIV